VLPTYKRSHKLKATIDSVFQQTYGKWELIVVDDNQPSDPHSRETENVMCQYRDHPNVVLIKHGVNKGACAARNTGIAAAKGEFIAFLDDDDIWATNKLELQVDALRRNPEAGFVFCDLICVDSTDNTRKRVKFGLSKDDLFRDLLKRGGGICTSALMIRKDLLAEIGGLDESLPSYQDYDLLLRLALRAKHAAIELPLLDYNVSSDGISRNYEAKFKGKKTIIDKYREHFRDRTLASYYGTHLEVLGDYAVLHGRRWVAIRYYAHAISKRPVSVSPYAKLLVALIGGESLYRVASSRYHKARRFIASGA
jgi:glycosyltransferase involved in cell wall biosynthesis